MFKMNIMGDLSLGMKLVSIHRILKFNVDFNLKLIKKIHSF